MICSILRIFSVFIVTLSFGTIFANAEDETVISSFTQNNIRHVLMHELAHALLREFDLPIMGNEESIAESFATISLHDIYSSEVQQIIKDRATALRYEAEQDGLNWKMLAGEHEHDFKRAYWNFCLLEGLEPDATQVPDWVHMSTNDAQDCQDIADDISNGWGKLLLTTLGKSDAPDNNVEIIFGEGPLKDKMSETGIMQEFALLLTHFNWPNRITLHFDHCDQGASWSRSERKILLCDAYVQRFANYETAAKTLFP